MATVRVRRMISSRSRADGSATVGSVMLDRGVQRLVEIPADVLGVLQPDRDAHEIRANTAGDEGVVVELLMGGRRRVDDERADITDVGEMAAQLDGFDEPPARVTAADDTE